MSGAVERFGSSAPSGKSASGGTVGPRATGRDVGNAGPGAMAGQPARAAATVGVGFFPYDTSAWDADLPAGVLALLAKRGISTDTVLIGDTNGGLRPFVVTKGVLGRANGVFRVIADRREVQLRTYATGGAAKRRFRAASVPFAPQPAAAGPSAPMAGPRSWMSDVSPEDLLAEVDFVTADRQCNYTRSWRDDGISERLRGFAAGADRVVAFEVVRRTSVRDERQVDAALAREKWDCTVWAWSGEQLAIAGGRAALEGSGRGTGVLAPSAKSAVDRR